MDSGLEFVCTFVYGNPTPQLRRGLWSQILAFKPSGNIGWCCIGDFNEMVSLMDKDGMRPQNQSNIALFRDFLNRAELIDLELKGCAYTWISNPRNGIVTKEKIDRVLLNWDWKRLFPHAIATALPIISSNHSPIILSAQPKQKSGVSFKFEAF